MSTPFYHCELAEPSPDFCREDIHAWFGLSYASYLTLPRSILQEMPAEWQHAFARLLDELSDQYTAPLDGGHYTVQTRDDNGRFVADPLRQYRYPSWHALERSRSSR